MTAAPSKKKLCFILPATGTSNVGGMEVVAKDLFHNLPADKYDFTLICFAADNGIIPRIDRSRVKIEVIEKRDGLDCTLVPRLAAYFYATRPDLLHTFNFGGLVYAMPAARFVGGLPIVHAEHGRLGVPERKTSAAIRRAMTRRVDHVTAVSEDLRQILCEQEGVERNKVSVIINGVDTRPMDDPAFDRIRYRESLGLGPEDFVVGTVGSLTPRKNQQMLIRAAAAVPCCKVLIAGKGPLESELDALISELGLQQRVRLVGERDDIPRFVRSLDLFALPSIMEGTSLAILEAMAARLPVLATDVGGSRELVEHDRTGFLVPSEDQAAFEDRLSFCASHPAECAEMGRRARQRIDERFSFARTAAAYDEVFEAVLAKRAPRRRS